MMMMTREWKISIILTRKTSSECQRYNMTKVTKAYYEDNVSIIDT